ncbi:hypothetical protein SDC9_189439 [bioreactor metagenome]|uniref:Uncharacterized protein n=1 Tax=bioreactor metagenome TaxID=1076179 RepID=A0A645I0D1_9ZZZZ
MVPQSTILKNRPKGNHFQFLFEQARDRAAFQNGVFHFQHIRRQAERLQAGMQRFKHFLPQPEHLIIGASLGRNTDAV